MYYLEIILFCLLIVACIKLKIENNHLKVTNQSNIASVQQNISLLREKQLMILDKMVLNQNFNLNLNTEIKQLSNEILDLHQDFIKQYVR